MLDSHTQVSLFHFSSLAFFIFSDCCAGNTRAVTRLAGAHNTPFLASLLFPWLEFLVSSSLLLLPLSFFFRGSFFLCLERVKYLFLQDRLDTHTLVITYSITLHFLLYSRSSSVFLTTFVANSPFHRLKSNDRCDLFGRERVLFGSFALSARFAFFLSHKVCRNARCAKRWRQDVGTVK